MHINSEECAKYKPVSFSKSHFSQMVLFPFFLNHHCHSILYVTNFLLENGFIYLCNYRANCGSGLVLNVKIIIILCMLLMIESESN